MKSFKKLRDFALQNHKSREKQNPPGHGSYVEPTRDVEEVTKGMQDVRGMQQRYEGLVTVSTQVSSRAYDLSTAVEEMASYLVNSYGQLDEEEIGKIFKVLGRVQFEISKSLETYASHVTQTVTAPTKILISELKHVTETKEHYDVKRQALDQHRMRLARGRPRNGKGDDQEDQQLQAAKEEFDEIAIFLGCRLLSLEQGRPRSLITQAARHHAAQMQLFSKGLTSLHDIEPYMKSVTQERNIARHLSSADEGFDDGDDEAASDLDAIDEDDVSYIDEEGQDHGHAQEQDSGSSSGNAANRHLDLSREWNSLLVASGSGRDDTFANEGFDSPVHRWSMKGSKSAPTSPMAISEGVDNIQEIDSSPHGYISPVPPPTRSPPVPLDRGHSGTGHGDIHSHEYFPSTPDRSLNHDLDSASPLHQSIIRATSPRRTTKMGVPMTMFPPFEPSPKSWPMPLPPSGDPPPVLNVEVPSLSSTPRGFVTVNSLEPKTKKRYSYSGPLTSTAVPNSGRISSKVPSSGPLRPLPSHSHKPGQPHSPQGHTFTSPKTSPTGTPSKMSPPRISELHKLPPPPLSASSSPVTASCASLVAHSAPLVRHQGECSLLYASPLPPPPLGNVTRSLSMSGRTLKSQKQKRFKGTAVTQLAEVDEEESCLPSQHGQPQSGHTPVQPSASKHQTGRSDVTSQHSMLQRSMSGSGGPRNTALESHAFAKTQSGSSDKKIRRLNTMLHTSPNLKSAYSVMSPPNVAAADGMERAKSGSNFELGRRSLDAAIPAQHSNSKWSKWKSFSSYDRDDFSNMAQSGNHNRESSQIYAHNPSPRRVAVNGGNGRQHVS